MSAFQIIYVLFAVVTFIISAMTTIGGFLQDDQHKIAAHGVGVVCGVMLTFSAMTIWSLLTQ